MRLTRPTPTRSRPSTMSCWKVKESRSSPAKKTSICHVVIWLTPYLPFRDNFSMFFVTFLPAAAYVEKVNRQSEVCRLCFVSQSVVYVFQAERKSWHPIMWPTPEFNQPEVYQKVWQSAAIKSRRRSAFDCAESLNAAAARENSLHQA